MARFPVRNSQGSRAVGDVDGVIGAGSVSGVRPCGIPQLGGSPLGGGAIQRSGNFNALIGIDDLDACNAAAGA